MEMLDSGEPFLHWDKNLSELSEAGEIDCALYTNVSPHEVMGWVLRVQSRQCERRVTVTNNLLYLTLFGIRS